MKRLCVQKKRHIGNDFVVIIWNESCGSLRNPFDVMKGHLSSVYIICTPIHHTPMLHIQIKAKKEIPIFGPLSIGEYVIPSHIAAGIIRQTALNANLACAVANDHKIDFSTNWVERLKLVNYCGY